MKFSGKVGDPDHGSVITDPDPDPYSDTSKTCLGGGMHYPSASI